jgi:outer membrane protein assembly factor BamE
MTAKSILPSQLKRAAVRAAACIALVALTACVYRINIQQGNFVKPEDVDRVQAGMTRSQVRFILGTPMVTAPFDNDRWDYYYYLVKGHSRKKDTRHVVVQFDGDKVARVERLMLPAASAAAPEPAAPATPPVPPAEQPAPKT